ncbi:hypothetical protein ATTO_01310 [Leptogranulimonas caecicola]|uniref:Uncharacterized protein n=1 Tax=Leptogranulimonas caecicola TaxID=2894156 RepID=A0AAU9D595_9ACTN|nr:hypothetical protein ATTO_01310 [Leptogranulimonas caecicola]
MAVWDSQGMRSWVAALIGRGDEEGVQSGAAYGEGGSSYRQGDKVGRPRAKSSSSVRWQEKLC